MIATRTQRFLAEAICSGAHQAIHKPSIPGLENFKGEAPTVGEGQCHDISAIDH